MKTFVWVGGNALWGDLAAWSPEGTPGYLDTVIFNEAAVVTGNNGASAATLEVTGNATGGVTVDGSIGVQVSHLLNPLVIVNTGTYDGGTTDSSVLITVQGTLGAMLANSGNLSIGGTFNGSFTNDAGGIISDDGTYNGAGEFDLNLGFLSIGGLFNFDTLTNQSTVELSGGTLTGNNFINDGGFTTMSHGTLNLGELQDGITASSSASLDLTNGSIEDLQLGFGFPTLTAPSTLVLNQSSIVAGTVEPGFFYAFVIGTGTLSMKNGSTLTDSSVLAGGQGNVTITIDGSTWANDAPFTAVSLGDPGTGDVFVTLANSATLTGGGIAIETGSTISGSGVISSSTIAMSSGAVIAAAGGTLVVGGTIEGFGVGGTLEVEGASTLELSGADFAHTITFAAGGTLRLDTPNKASSAIGGFGNGDLIVLSGVSVSSHNFVPAVSGGTLELELSNSTTADLVFSGGYSQDSFAIASAGADSDVSFVACFAEGTRIATVSGPVAVERLSEGDTLLTVAGRGQARVRWLGHRRVDCSLHARPEEVWPVRVCAGAFAAGVPRRDLLLSPDHAVWVSQGGTDMLIPVRHLRNGISIVQEKCDGITYWHVELDRHDVLLAEDLPCESYLDTGNRALFLQSDWRPSRMRG